MTERNKGGRPEFRPTSAQRREVARLRMVGMEMIDISRVIGCSEPTLRKHFDDELSSGYAKRRAAVYEALEKNAIAGNVSAQKALITLFEKADALPPAPRQRAVPKPGKKEIAQAEAQTAHETSDWGTLVH